MARSSYSRDVKVDIPERKRIRKQNGQRYVYAVLARAGKDDPKDVVKLVGKLTEDGKKMYPNEDYYSVFPDAAKPEPAAEHGPKDTQTRIGAVAAVRKVADDTGISDCLRLAFPDKAGLILDFAAYCVVARDSAAMLYSDFMFDHWSDLEPIPSEATVSRMFNHGMTEEAIDNFRASFLRHSFVGKDNGGRVYVDVDSTNENVSSHGVESAEYGKPKDDEDLPQINMAYLYDRETGAPVFYDCFYGSITDITWCTVGMDRFLGNRSAGEKVGRYAFILDRGYFSRNNVEWMMKGKLEFAVMGKAGKAFSEFLAKHRAETESSASLLSTGIHGIRTKEKSFGEDSGELYVYLYLDSTKRTQEQAGIEAALITAKRALEGKRKDRNGGLKRTYSKWLTIDEDALGNIRSVATDAARVDAKMAEAGFFWIVSDMEMSPEDMLGAYRARDGIEKCFRLLKSENDLSKTYAQTEDAMRAKTLLGFVTAVLRSEITFRTREMREQKGNVSTQKILLELDKIIMSKAGNSYSLKYAYTAFQQQAMNAIGLSKKDVGKIITACNRQASKID